MTCPHESMSDINCKAANSLEKVQEMYALIIILLAPLALTGKNAYLQVSGERILHNNRKFSPNISGSMCWYLQVLEGCIQMHWYVTRIIV